MLVVLMAVIIMTMAMMMIMVIMMVMLMMIMVMVIRRAGYLDRHRMKNQVKMIDGDDTADNDAFDNTIADADASMMLFIILLLMLMVLLIISLLMLTMLMNRRAGYLDRHQMERQLKKEQAAKVERVRYLRY